MEMLKIKRRPTGMIELGALEFQPVIVEEYWRNSPLNMARHYGGVILNGKQYVIVDREGRDIYELSAEAEREGRELAIGPGEPADLCRLDWLEVYKALGRADTLALVGQQKSLEEAKQIAKERVRSDG